MISVGHIDSCKIVYSILVRKWIDKIKWWKKGIANFDMRIVLIYLDHFSQQIGLQYVEETYLCITKALT